ncbi:hypothetical protein EDD86DRAFT_186297 [Gorgonomyces haynaldii]|nr:hypothetical protein EDD86DRAFT_186297 [Gorgonomyces haynaldii]
MSQNHTGEPSHPQYNHPPVDQIPSLEEVVQAEEQFLGRKLEDFELEEIKRRIAFMKEHQGHESQHAEMVLIMFGALIVSQVLISIWKKYHPGSYNIATLLGLWIVPMLLAMNAGNTRFEIVWIIFSLVNGYIVKRALESPMRSMTPRLVYSWYSRVYDVCYLLVIVGYGITLVAFFHLPVVFGTSNKTEGDVFVTGILMMFYGLYFGTLGRDFVDRLSDRMAQAMGYYAKQGFPKKHLRENTCAICGETTRDSSEELQKLVCGHTYHLGCIKGWLIVGKKDMCPYCKENVDLAQFKGNPWDTTQQFYLALLDALRYLLVWNPVVFLIIHVVFGVLHLK